MPRDNGAGGGCGRNGVRAWVEGGVSGGQRVEEHPSITLTKELRLVLRFFCNSRRRTGNQFSEGGGVQVGWQTDKQTSEREIKRVMDE